MYKYPNLARTGVKKWPAVKGLKDMLVKANYKGFYQHNGYKVRVKQVCQRHFNKRSYLPSMICTVKQCLFVSILVFRCFGSLQQLIIPLLARHLSSESFASMKFTSLKGWIGWTVPSVQSVRKYYFPCINCLLSCVLQILCRFSVSLLP